MSNKHTPGPWEVLNSTSVFSALGADSGDGTAADHNDGWSICDCSVGATCVGGDYVELGFSVQKANARLIAAAPDLLSSLKGLLAAYEDPGNTGSTHDDKVQAARDAISKATA